MYLQKKLTLDCMYGLLLHGLHVKVNFCNLIVFGGYVKVLFSAYFTEVDRNILNSCLAITNGALQGPNHLLLLKARDTFPCRNYSIDVIAKMRRE